MIDPPQSSRSNDPFIGARPFSRDDAQLFFGRDDETIDIEGQVLAHRVVLLYGKSGTGKSSLIEAGLAPRVSAGGWMMMPTARPGAPLPPEAPVEVNVYVFNALFVWQRGLPDNETMGEYLARTKQGVPRVLVFDQFEECFTAYPNRGGERREFFRQLQLTLQSDVQLRALISVREEFIAELESYLEIFPLGDVGRMRLQWLAPEEARRALTLPFLAVGKTLTPPAADRLLRHLTMVAEPIGGGRSKLVQQDSVEPMQLQVLGSELWLRLPPGTPTIVQADALAVEASDPIATLYDRALLYIAAKGAVREGEMRRWFGEILITPAETRATIFRGERETGGMSNEVVDVLALNHLLRSELRGGGIWFEISHDRFIQAIRKSNRAWDARHANEFSYAQELETRAAEWMAEQRSPQRLLNGDEPQRAARWIGSDEALEAGYSATVELYVRASLHDQQRAATTRRWRSIAFGGLIVTLLLISGLSMLLAHKNRLLVNASQQAGYNQRQLLALQDQALFESRKLIADKDTAIGDKDKALGEKDKAIGEKDMAIGERDEATAKYEALEIANRVISAASDPQSQRGTSYLLSNDGQMFVKRALLSASATFAHSGFVRPEADQAMRLLLPIFDVGNPAPYPSLNIASDGRTVIAIDRDGTVSRWDLARRSAVSLKTPTDPAQAPSLGILAPPFVIVSPEPDGLWVWNRAGRLFFLGDSGDASSQPLPPNYVLTSGSAVAGRVIMRSLSDLRVYDHANGKVTLAGTIALPNAVSSASSGSSQSAIAAIDPTDPNTIATGQGDGFLTVWSLKDAIAKKRIACQTGPLRLIAFSDAGRRIMTVGQTQIQVVDSVDGSVVQKVPTTLGRDSNMIVASPDARYVAGSVTTRNDLGTVVSQLTVVDTALSGTGATLQPESRSFNGPLSGIRFTSGHHQLVIANQQGNISAWNLDSADQPPDLPTARFVRYGLWWQKDGLVGTAIGEAGDPSLGIVSQGLWTRSTPGGYKGTLRVLLTAFDATHNQFVTGTRDDNMQFFDAATGNPVGPARQHKGLTDLVLDPRGELLVSSAAGGSIKIWHRGSADSHEVKIPNQTQPVLLAFSPSGDLIASGGQQYASIWRRDGTFVKSIGSGDGGRMVVAFAGGDSQLLISNSSGQVEVWDIQTGAHLRTLGTRSSGVAVWDVATDVVGHLAVVADSNKQLGIYDIASGTLLASFSRTESARRVVFSPDGKWISSVSEQGNLRFDPISETDLMETMRRSLTSPIKREDCKTLIGPDDIAHVCPPPYALKRKK